MSQPVSQAPFRLDGKVAAITGAGAGIGAAIAHRFAAQGCAVALLDVDVEAAQTVVQELEHHGTDAEAIACDVSRRDQVAAAFVELQRRFGGLDILVNNAGKQVSQPAIGDITAEQFDATLKTNLYALFWITQAATPHLKPGAAIINTASVQAYDPSASLLDYATTKAGIVAFSKALAKQLIEKGVRVNAVAPGPFWTALQPSGGQTQEKVQHFGEHSAFGRPGQPVEIAPVYVLLASQEASYITGEVYGVTGGEGVA